MKAGLQINIAASVLARLLNRSRESGEDFQVLLNNFAIERFLYRLSISSVKDRFLLKGAMLLRIWSRHPYRSTMDLDLLYCSSENDIVLRKDIRAICRQEAGNDGIEFLAESLRMEPIREDQEYMGTRISLPTKIGSARLRIQIDVGRGDAVTPSPRKRRYPGLLDFPKPVIKAYAPESVVAEKLEALVVLGLQNSRIKDYFDLHFLASHFSFSGDILAKAVAKTFMGRHTVLPNQMPAGLTDDYWEVSGRDQQVRAFARRARLNTDLPSARSLLPLLRQFLWPPLEAAGEKKTFHFTWPSGGPWRKGGG